MSIPVMSSSRSASSFPQDSGGFAVTSARRFEAFIRWTAYLTVSLPLLTITVGALLPSLDKGVPPVILAITAVLTIVVVAFNIIASRASINRTAGTPSRMPVVGALIWAAVLVALLGLLVALPAVEAGVALTAAVGSSAASIIPRLSIRDSALLNAGVVLVTAPSIVVVGVPLFALNIAAISVALWASWFSAWSLRVLLELQRVYIDQGELSLANERLRISRDLHDVFGRTLATIALKSELAAELIRRDSDERAADEILAVRQLADAAGTEVRHVIRGELHPTWDTELAGARSLLNSAGITCIATGDAVPESAASPLGWVVREGITNVLRHSHATRVTIATSTASDEVRLTIVNDGTDHQTAQSHTGTGLRSMAERLQVRGGAVSTRVEGEWFTLDAAVPNEGDLP